VNLSSHLVQRMLKLSPPVTRDLVVHPDLPVRMPDGVELLADRWVPRVGGDALPTALIRSPYGRKGLVAMGMVRPLAERGYQVLIQSTRGTFGSGGVFDPLRREREDGLATLDWVVKQPWFNGSMVLVGASYLGYVQWAVTDRLPPEVKAMIPVMSESALSLEHLRGDGLTLETPFSWGVTIAGQERRWALPRQLLQVRRTRRDILAHDADAPRWAGIDHRQRVSDTTVPVSSIGGWYDIFLPGQLRDFQILQDAGRDARVMIGPWSHIAVTGLPIEEMLDFGLAHARGEQPPERAPVRLFVTGEEAWRDFTSWPPGGFAPQRFYLQSDGALSDRPPGESGSDIYRYDPADPTPAVGGARSGGGGRVDNSALEARADVLTYTTPVLDTDVEVIGEVSAEIWLRSSLPFADVFVRLCDVDPDGHSVNVCDGLTSLTQADQLDCTTVRLWPTAHRFRRGHRIRVQVSSGAFPRYARNLGTGEPHATATTLRAADQTVHHDPQHPSAIILPTRTATSQAGETID